MVCPQCGQWPEGIQTRLMWRWALERAAQANPGAEASVRFIWARPFRAHVRLPFSPSNMMECPTVPSADGLRPCRASN